MTEMVDNILEGWRKSINEKINTSVVAFVTINIIRDGIVTIRGNIDKQNSSVFVELNGAETKYKKDEWFLTIEEALENAEIRRKKYIKRLNLNLNRIKTMKFKMLEGKSYLRFKKVDN
jgi:hypothetical protein